LAKSDAIGIFDTCDHFFCYTCAKRWAKLAWSKDEKEFS